MSIDYSDGVDIERHILKLLQQQTDLRSTTPIALEEYGNWPVQYHLSPQRSNLLRHLDFAGLDVLELGAGMGAVSRFLAESARTLTVVEGSAARYEALQARLRDLDNWKGQVANIQDVQFDEKYDVVCVIGVLEYSELYVDPIAGGDAFDAFLQKASQFLKDDGVLIVAIENKLGLKYWNGAAEDHTGRMFDGICDYSTHKSPKTFSRKELIEKISKSGLRVVDVQLPFPDYKLTSSVLTQHVVEENISLATALGAEAAYNSYSLPKNSFFPYVLSLQSVAKAGLLSDFSNSFLCIASKTDANDTLFRLTRRQASSKEVAWHYANNRRIPTKTVFSHDLLTENWLVEKTTINDESVPNLQSNINGFSFKWKSLPLQQVKTGIEIKTLLLRQAYFDEWDEFVESLKNFLSWSFEYWKSDDDSSLRGQALDAVVNNALLNAEWSDSIDQQNVESTSSQRFELFDLEWKLETPLPKTWFILRNVMALSAAENEVFSVKAPFQSFKELYNTLCLHFELIPNFEVDVMREASFYSIATANPSVELWNEQIMQGRASSFLPSLLPRDPLIESDSRELARNLMYQYANPQLYIAGMVSNLESTNYDLRATLASPTYRIAKRLNLLLQRIPFVHQLLKSAFLKYSSGR